MTFRVEASVWALLPVWLFTTVPTTPPLVSPRVSWDWVRRSVVHYLNYHCRLYRAAYVFYDFVEVERGTAAHRFAVAVEKGKVEDPCDGLKRVVALGHVLRDADVRAYFP